MSTQLERRQQLGLTLIELIMFIVIVGIAVIGVMGLFSYTARNSVDPLLRKQAQAIAEGLLEEVELAHFTYCDPNDATAETAGSATIGSGACASIVENVGPEPATASYLANTRPYDNVNDYVTAFGVPQRAFDVDGVLADASGNKFGARAQLRDYQATLTITPDTLNGIAATAAPTSMDVLRLSVTVSYNGGRDAVTLDGYRTRHSPTSIP
jgi:MSHA pilin protein MshD